ncbi:hypothetical protein FRC03_011510 [Tulasnella sp. 419]|nr:hypothetical protein FRC03_011510 [Tulasnella sp. 419]
MGKASDISSTQSERYENAGQIEWASARNIKLTFGVRTVHVDTMTRKNKPQSRSRRFKASDGMEYKWRPVESNPQNLECLMVSEKKVVATYDADSTTLIVIAEGQGILDEIVVLLLVHLYRRANNIDFIQSQLSTS